MKTPRQSISISLLLLSLFSFFTCFAQNPFGTGVDGAITVATGTTNTTPDDVKTTITGLNTTGALTISVTSATGFAVNHEILIITMQDPDVQKALTSVGIYETTFVAAVNAAQNTLTLTAPLKNTYDARNGAIHQVLRVPNYASVTVNGTGILTCDDWNGTTGGVLFFRVNGTVAVNATGQIHANGKGYRGGLGTASTNQTPGGSGEGIAGNFNISGGAAKANGAGQGNGGGGGGHGTAGESSLLEPTNGGTVVGDTSLSRLIMGGGGGGGFHRDAPTNSVTAGADGDGGGIVVIYARDITGNAIRSNGNNGAPPHASNTNADAGDGGGGGGAGGSIHLITKSIIVTDLKATGGVGAASNCFNCWPIQVVDGGDGGAGRIRLDSASAPAITAVSPAQVAGQFQNIAHTPLVDTPIATGTYTVNAHIVDNGNDPITSATLFYSLNADATFTPVAMATSDNFLYTATIPSQSGGVQVRYYVTATDGTDNYANPIGAPTTATHSFRVTGSSPVNLSATASTTGTVTVNWSAPANTTNLTGYSVYRGTVAGFTANAGNRIAVLTSTDFSYLDADGALADFSRYYYQVAADYSIGGVISSHGVEVSAVVNNTSVVIVRGTVRREFGSDHANINVVFTKISPSAVSTSTTTNAAGFFQLTIIGGVYDVTFQATDHQTFPIRTNQSIIDDLDVGTTTLDFLGTPVPAGNVSGVWNGVRSISGNVTVAAGTTLTIQPGTEVRVLGNFSFVVNGNLQAIGTAVAPILFTSLPVNQVQARGQWQGIDFNDSSDDASIIRFATIEYAVDGVSWTNANAKLEEAMVRENSESALDIRGDASDPVLTDVEIYNNSVDGIFIENGDPTLVDIDCHHNTGNGLETNETSVALTIINSHFDHNTGNGIFMDRNGFLTLRNTIVDDNDADGVLADEAYLVIDDCTITNNSSEGIRVNDVNRDFVAVTIVDTLIHNNRDMGIYLIHRIRPESSIRGCTISNNGNPLSHAHPAIRLHHRVFVDIVDNDIVNNHSHGILYDSSTENQPTIVGNVIAYNFHDGINKGISATAFTMTVTYNTIYQNGGDGIEINNATGTEIIANNIIANNVGVGIRPNVAIETFEYNDFFTNTAGNASATTNLPTDSLTFVVTNPNGTPSDIYANLNQNPLFNLANALDFSLASGSPAVNGGDPDVPDPDSTTSDIGAVYRDAGNPHEVRVTGYSHQAVALNWPAGEGSGVLLSYNVYFRVAGAANYTLFGNTTQTTANVTGLTNNTLYEFAVSALYNTGESIRSLRTAFERPGTPVLSVDPSVFRATVPAAGLTQNIEIENTGTRDLTAQFLVGRVGSAFFNTDVNDYIQIGNHANLSGFTELTMECWIRRANNGHLEFMGKHYEEYEFYVDAGNRLGIYKGYNAGGNRLYQNFTSVYVLPAAEWHHVAATWSGVTVTFYVDGEMVDRFDTAASLPIFDWGHNFDIGRRGHDGGLHISGNLAEVRVWNVARTQDQIRQFMKASLTGNEPGLRGYWPLSSNFNDRTTFARHGTGFNGVSASVNNLSPPTYPLLPITIAEGERLLAPNSALALPFTFADTGRVGTFTYHTPILTSVVNERVVLYHLFLTYGAATPVVPTPFSITNVGDRFFGNGADGALVVSAGQTVTTDDVRAAMIGVNPAGSSVVTLADGTDFAAGDEILIITMQDSEVTDRASNRAGIHETKTIATVGGDNLYLEMPLEQTYDATDGSKHQVIRVPNYTDVTIAGTVTCASWNGETGGICYFKASGTVTIAATGVIDASGKGYRGGTQFGGGHGGGQGGESYAGLGGLGGMDGSGHGKIGSGGGGALYNCCLGGDGFAGGGGGSTTGGGGQGSADNGGAGGGGGGHAGSGGGAGYGSGGYGGWSYNNNSEADDGGINSSGDGAVDGTGGGGGGGGTYGTADLARLLLGSGGGMGGRHTSGTPGAGGNGGGLVLIRAAVIQGDGVIRSNGNNAGSRTGSFCGGGGGGSGGAVVVNGGRVDLATRFSIAGGVGSVGHYGNLGGDGGLGRIRVNYNVYDRLGHEAQLGFEGAFTGISATQLNDSPNAAGPYAVKAYVFPASGAAVTSVSLFFQVNNGGFGAPVTMTSTDGVLYTGNIPGQAAGAEIAYYVSAATTAGTLKAPANAPASVYSFSIIGRPVAAVQTTDNADGTIRLTWDEPLDDTNLVDYTIYRREIGPIGPLAEVLAADHLTATTYLDNAAALVDFHVYAYRIAANYNIGGVQSIRSTILQETVNDVNVTTVKGFVYLAGESNHANTTVVFTPTSASAAAATATTDAFGYFERTISAGNYDISYQKAGFQTFPIVVNQSVIVDRDLGETTLDALGITGIAGNVSGTWDGVYSIASDVVVPSGQTLTIKPGTRVQFLGNFQFDVLGRLEAIGEEFLFTANNLGNEDVAEIDMEEIPATLAAAFAGEGITISGGAAVTVLKAASRWRLVDGEAIYLLRENDGDVDVYDADEANRIVFTSLPANQQKAPGQWQGVDFEDSSNDLSIVSHAIVEYAVDGIFWNNASATVENAIVRFNSNIGLYINNDPSNPVVTNVEVNNNSSYGIYVLEGNPILTTVHSHHNNSFGIYYQNNAYGTVTNSKFNANGSHGIRLLNYSSPTFDGCEINDNDSWGVRIDYSEPTIRNSTIARNIGYGIVVSADNNNWTTPRFVNLLVEDNTATGIYLARYTRPDTQITDCTIRNNNGYGIYLWHYTSAMIRRNRIFDNANAGISFNNQDNNTSVLIDHNIIAYNAGDGIYKDNRTGSSPTISYNTIYQNTGDGIEVNHDSTERILNNVVVNNGGVGVRANSAIESFAYNNIVENTGGEISNTANLPGNAWVFPEAVVNENGDPADIHFNISEAPLFALDDDYDFRPLPASPNINAGDPANRDADDTISDIGAVFRDLGIPHDVVVSGYANGSVSLNWSPIVNNINGTLTNYKVYHKLSSAADEPGNYTALSGIATNTATVTGLTNNLEYDFAVTGLFVGGYESPFSALITERPGVPLATFNPTAFVATVDAATKTENLVVTNTGTRDLNVDFLLGMDKGSTQFDGNGDLLHVGAHANLSGMSALTVESWIRRNNDGHFEFVSKHYQEYSLYIASNNRFGIYKGFDHLGNRFYQNWTTDYQLPAGEWHHLALTWSGNTITFYADGEVVGEYDNAVDFAIPNYGYNFQIGRRADEGAYYLNGNLAEVRVWNVVRTQEQIQRYIDSPLLGNETGLVGYWPLHQDFQDRTTFQKHGSVNGNVFINSSISPPALPKLPFTLPAQTTYTIAPGTSNAVTVPFTFQNTGQTGTFTHVTPVTTDIPATPTINYELALTYGTPVPPTPVHFSPVAPSGKPYMIVITDATIDGVTLGVGDEVAVFDGNLCVGAAVFEGTFNMVVVAQEQNTGGFAGFTAGNPIVFKIYDNSADLEAVVTPATTFYFIGSGLFGYNKFSSVEIEGTVFAIQSIALVGNQYNLISFNKLPRFAASSIVFGGLQSLRIVQNDRGQSLIPGYPINSIRDIDFRDGYHVFTTSNETLQYQGIPVDPADWTITLEPGKWNSVAFLGSAPQDITTAFGDIDDSIAAVQTSDGTMWEPEHSINTIVNLMPGRGYQVVLKPTVTTAVTFFYHITGPAGGRSAESDTPAAEEDDDVKPTGRPYNIIVANASGLLPIGARIYVYDGDRRVGRARYQGEGNLLLTAWENVPLVDLAGFRAGRPITLKIETGNGAARTFHARFVQGDGTFGNRPYAIISALTDAPVVAAVATAGVATVGTTEVTNRRIVDLNVSANGTGGPLQWLVTETSEAPDNDDLRWSSESPKQYQIGGAEGTVQLHVWAKDADGDVSAAGEQARRALRLDLGLKLFALDVTNAAADRLVFGIGNLATDDFDPDYDQEAVVSGSNRVFFEQRRDRRVDRRLAADFRSKQAAISRWRLQVEADEQDGSELSFQIPDELGNQWLVFQELLDEQPVGQPVYVHADTTVPVSGTATFEIALGEPEDHAVSVAAGWNLVSIPTMTTESVGAIFADSLGGQIKDGAPWVWDGSELQMMDNAETPNPEVGYWVRGEVDGVGTTFAGVAADGVVRLRKGWNLVGPVAAAALGDVPQVTIVWAWDTDNQRYSAVRNDESLTPGQGYWVYANDEAEVELGAE